ncbi:hypothetical protein BSKO_13169 [Bryopsis sp. KO-2023]|nr:hypothetical protein BSKO_13169 [Bryopsis sp. KO-2023]
MLGLCPRSVLPPFASRFNRLHHCTRSHFLRRLPPRYNQLNASPSGALYGMDVENRSSEMLASSPSFQVMVAVTKSFGIGRDNGLPWVSIPADMAYFKKLTTETRDASKRNAVVMGRKTWEGIPAKFRPLSGRLNVVLSRNEDWKIAQAGGNNEENSGDNRDAEIGKDVLVCRSLASSLAILGGEPYASEIEHVFVIGGAQVFNEALAMEGCEAIHLTKVDADFMCDTFLPAIDSSRFRTWASSQPRFDKKAKPEPVGYSFHTLTNTHSDSPPILPPGLACQHEEQQYLDMISDIIETGVSRGDRTGTGTLSKFGTQMRFNLRNSFPLLTTKRVFWTGVVEELLWFISGSTNSILLSQKGVRIWEGNGSRQFLDSVGLGHREEGDLGPVYGFQWRHFGAKYVDMHTDYTGQGVDQLAEVIRKIKETPNDRRIVMSAWNPADLELMALPPCHMFCQFYVANGELSCQMYQRSCDMGLGVPFNIASYALLTCMIAHVCDLKPGDFIHTLGDAHVYSNHVEPLKRQLLNSPMAFPVLELNRDVKDIDSFSSGDIVLKGYKSHKKIAMEMAV